jgi:hypothetical protein
MKLLKVMMLAALLSVLLMGQTGGGSVSWSDDPKEIPNGWYWAYDDASEPPFADPLMPPMPTFHDIHNTGNKIAPYGGPYQYTMPDSFWFYGVWYEPGDKLFISEDGWVSFDNTSEEGFPDPPVDDPPFPVTANPNALIAPLWQDMDLSRTPGNPDNNRVYYEYYPATRVLGIEWYQVEGKTSGNVFTFETLLSLGGQDKLVTEGSCGIVFSYHFIHFLYNTTSAGWDADNLHDPPAVGIEDYQGIYYEGELADDRVIRMGYKKVFQHDIEAYAFLSPGRMVLRYTPFKPVVVVRNIGQETEQFTVTLDIYNGEEQVYHNMMGTCNLLSGQSDTLEAPCWEPGEIDELYDKVLLTSLGSDMCTYNDTLIVQSLVHCDDTLCYDWNYGDIWSWGINSGDYHFMTFYGVDGGVLVTGGQTYLTSLYGTGYPAMEVYEANAGCGATGPSNVAAEATCETFQAGWNQAWFGGFGAWVSAAAPGNIWAGWTPASTPSGYHGESGMLTWPGLHSCYSGGGFGRGAWMSGSSFYWGGHYSSYYTGMNELFVHLGFGEYPLSPLPAPPCYDEMPHDVTAFRMEEPNIDWVEAGVAITPEIAIANIGRQAEPDGGVFPVKFYAIDTYGKINWVDNDTIFADTQQVSHIGWMGDETDDPDTMFVEMDEWVPEGVCHETEPFVFYELIGLVQLGEVGPDESDHCPYNDTVRRNVSCLLSHDVGVIDLFWPEEPDMPPDIYGPGSTITPSCIVENFGYHEEHDVEVRCVVIDLDSNDVELWHSLQNITFLDWRGNVPDNPYTIQVDFPTYNVLTDWHRQTLYAQTELINDDCPDNDREWGPRHSVEELKKPKSFSLEVFGVLKGKDHQVYFTVVNEAYVEVSVYDINGRQVKSLVSETCQPGEYSRTWDRTDNAGRRVAAGVYLIRMQAGEFNAVRKALIIR